MRRWSSRGSARRRRPGDLDVRGSIDERLLMIQHRTLRALLRAGSLAAGLTLAGCASAPPTPAAPTTPPTESAPRVASDAKDEPPGDGTSRKSESAAAAGAERYPEPAAAQVAQSAPQPPPEPKGAPPSWLAKPAAPYRAGDAAQYLPKDCKARVFLDIGGLVGSNGSEIRAAIEQLVSATGDAKEESRVKKTIAVIREAGADPITDWRELAACGNGREVIAIGIARDKPLEVPILAQKVKVAVGDDPGAVIREGDLSMHISADGEVIAQPAPQVFLISKDKEAILEGIKKKAGRPGFAATAGHLLFAKLSEADATIKQSGDRLDIAFIVHLSGSGAAGAKKDPKGMTTKLEGKLNGLADGLKGTPLEPIGERLRRAKVTVRGTDATMSGTVQRSSVISILKSLRPGEMEELLRVFK